MRNDTAAPLWKKKYRVRVPSIALRSDEEIRLLGIDVDSNSDVQTQIKMDTRICMLSAVEIAEIYSDGYRITELSDKSIISIYTDIINHLTAWKEHTEHSMHKREAPTDDLKLLEEVAHMLFEMNKHLFVKEVQKNSLTTFGKNNNFPISPFGKKDKPITTRDISRPVFSNVITKKFSMNNIANNENNSNKNVIDFESLQTRFNQ